ncbi:hypothetical protein V8E54_008761 [Elaphomyces granulatus]
MAVPQKAAELHPSSIFATAKPKDIELWAPTNFAEGDKKIYTIAANHRGDMYHVRGAMTLVPHPLLVYDCPNRPTELTDYLAKPVPANDVFLTTWSWDMLVGSDDPGPDYSKQTFTVHGESMATTIIKDNVKKEADWIKLANGMAIIDKGDKENLQTEFINLCGDLFENPPSASITTILVQYRDTGTQGGIYPELDSSDASIVQIASYIRDASEKSTKPLQLNIELCGNVQPIGDLHSIGEYFRRIDSERWPKNTKRDLEAFFLRVAFEAGYFDMALGFRSGGLDVFTFLRVPSISISARQLVGEKRHGEIAVNKYFKRLNNTKYTAKDNLLGSPWWLFDKEHREPTPEDRGRQSTPPSGFHDFDGSIVKIGIYNAIVILLDLGIQPTIKPDAAQAREFNNKVCRKCYYSNIDFCNGDLFNFQTLKKAQEVNDFNTREGEISEREEPEDDFNKWKKEMEDDWSEILKRLPPPLLLRVPLSTSWLIAHCHRLLDVTLPEQARPGRLYQTPSVLEVDALRPPPH